VARGLWPANTNYNPKTIHGFRRQTRGAILFLAVSPLSSLAGASTSFSGRSGGFCARATLLVASARTAAVHSLFIAFTSPPAFYPVSALISFPYQLPLDLPHPKRG
jgi:hypothetical protein